MSGRIARALARRDFQRYFGNPTGYLFITLFIFSSAAAAFWRPRFYLNNLANLDQLNEVFAYLLMFFVPALTMSVWADERKQGTDELLLTLPATDAQLVFGKYFAVLGVYTVSLILSSSHAAVLFWLGRPDPGLLASTYIGYWLAGAGLITAGMLGSLLTANTTVAFVFAVAFCGLPVTLDVMAGALSQPTGRLLAPLALPVHLDEFARGVVSLASTLYFVGLAGLFLYLQVVLVGRRHWIKESGSVPLGVHHTVRGVAVTVALVSAFSLVGRAGLRVDVTAEQLHSVGPETRRLLSTLDPDRPVLIQAFVSPEVPEEYVQERATLVGTLREIEAIGGSRLEILIQSTEPYTDAARTARERFGIVPRIIASETTGNPHHVFLGVAFTAGGDEQVIPFFDRGLVAEYELVRAIRVVARASRKRVGIVDTEARIFGGVDYEGGRTRVSWGLVSELARQYEVVQVTPWERIEAAVDALLVVLPSTLGTAELDRVMEAVRSGVPTLFIVDPIPAMNMRLAPAAAMADRVNPYAPAGQALVTRNTGDIQKALAEIGVAWSPTRAAWDSYRPHADAAQLPLEIVFVGTGNGNPNALNRTHPASSGLQQVMLMYPGFLARSDVDHVAFEPLLATGRLAGTAGYFQLVQPTPAGPMLNVTLPHDPEDRELILAAHLRGVEGATHGFNVVVIADLDFVSDQFFAMRSDVPFASTLDNIAFFLNCIDVLTGDDSFIELRNRRVRHRTLERVEAETRTFVERRSRESRQAAAEAEEALERARQGMSRAIEQIEQRPDLDAQAKQIMIRNVEEAETRKLQALQANIEQARDVKIQASRENMEAELRRIQGAIRATAVLLPPLPIFLVGVVIFVRRRRREREGAAAARRLRGEV